MTLSGYRQAPQDLGSEVRAQRFQDLGGYQKYEEALVGHEVEGGPSYQIGPAARDLQGHLRRQLITSTRSVMECSA